MHRSEARETVQQVECVALSVTIFSYIFADLNRSMMRNIAHVGEKSTAGRVKKDEHHILHEIDLKGVTRLYSDSSLETASIDERSEMSVSAEG